MLLLLGCASPTPLVLPIGPPAETGEPLPVDALLAPTPFGASNGLLCPWSTGAAIDDSLLIRWIAEKRLTWRVLVVGAQTTFGGRPLAEAYALSEAARTLEERCAVQLPRRYLIAAGPDIRARAVFDGVYALGRESYEDPWILVEDPTPMRPELPTPPPAAAPTTPRAPAIDVLDALTMTGAPLRQVTLLAADPPVALSADGAGPASVAEALALRPDCAIVTSEDTGPWSALVALADQAHEVGAEVMLAKLWSDKGSSRAEAVDVGVAARGVGLHAELAVLPLATPRYCGPASGCGCASSIQSSSTRTLDAALDDVAGSGEDSP